MLLHAHAITDGRIRSTVINRRKQSHMRLPVVVDVLCFVQADLTLHRLFGAIAP
jgi:hypothetical protein